MKTKKRNKFSLVIFLFIFSLVIFLFSLYLKFSVLETMEIDSMLIIGDKIGLDVSTDILFFGVIPTQSASQKTIFIENDYDFPIKAEFKSFGNITKFLLFEKRIYLEEKENKSFIITAISPAGEKPGFYSGKILVKIKRS